MGAGPRFDYKLYPKFVSLVRVTEGVEPKNRAMLWLMRLIEDLYEARYHADVEALRRSGADEGGEGGEDSATPFPVFVYAFFEKKFGLPSLVQQQCWDMLFTMHQLRKESQAIETFGRFMDEYYDSDDLLFALYARSTLQKELAKEQLALDPKNLSWSFRTHWSSASSAAATRLEVSGRQAANVARVVFGSEGDPNYRAFMTLLERTAGLAHGASSSSGTLRARQQQQQHPEILPIDVATFLHLALGRYHETRGIASGGGGGGGGAGGGGSGRGGAGAGAASSEADRLFREAVNSYEDRRRAAPAGTPTAGGAGAGAGAGSGRPAGLAPSQELLAAIAEGMNEAMQELLERLLAPHGALREEVRGMVRAELQEAIEGKVDGVLGEVIAGAQPGAPLSGSAEVDALARRFGAVVAADAAGQGSGAAAGAFCSEVVGCRLVREPMAELCATLAQHALSQGE